MPKVTQFLPLAGKIVVPDYGGTSDTCYCSRVKLKNSTLFLVPAVNLYMKEVDTNARLKSTGYSELPNNIQEYHCNRFKEKDSKLVQYLIRLRQKMNKALHKTDKHEHGIIVVYKHGGMLGVYDQL